MGIYVFRLRLHPGPPAQGRRRKTAPPTTFGSDLIPELVKQGGAYSRTWFNESCVRAEGEKEAYWRDVGTLDSFWEANIDLCTLAPALDIYDRSWPIWTYAELNAPAKVRSRRRRPHRPRRWLAGGRRAPSSPAAWSSTPCSVRQRQGQLLHPPARLHRFPRR